MASTNLSIKYRPIRIGFLVREGSVEDVVKAVGFNTILWGGIHNPIIPVGVSDTTFAERLIDLFSVDVLYAVSSTPEILQLRQRYSQLRDPGHYTDTIYSEDWRTKKKELGYLDSKNLVDYYWQNEFKHKPKEYKSPFVLPRWDTTDELGNLFSLEYGYFPKFPGIEFIEDYEKAFLNGLRANEQTIQLGGSLVFDPAQNYSPIVATAFELTGYDGGIRRNGHGIYFGNGNNFNDLICFWNLRASGISLSFLAADAQERTLATTQNHLSLLETIPDRHPGRIDPLTLYYSIDDETAINTILGRLTATKPIDRHRVTDSSWNGFNIQPSTYIFGWKQTTADVDDSRGRYVVTVRLPDKPFLIDLDHRSRQYIGVTVDAYSEFGYPEHTLKPPYLKQLNEFWSREIAIDPWALRIEKGSISYLAHADSDSFTLHPLPHQLMIDKLLELKELKLSISQPGVLARKIIENVNGIEGARFLKIAGVRKLLQGKKPDETFTYSDATKIIYENNFRKYEDLYIEARESGKLTSQQTFNFLIKNNFVRAGLELQCENCNLYSWLSLKQLDDRWVCEYCGANNLTSSQLKNRGDWKFRKSGLFAKDNNQEGSVPVLLTVLTFNRLFQTPNFIYSTALKLSGAGVDCEIDFAVLKYDPHRSIDLCIGECKSSGGIFEQDDCNKLVSVYKKITAEDQIQCYITFSKTADNFTAEEIERFKKLQKDKIPIILMTNRELEPYHPYHEGDDKDIPEKYVGSLSDLANNSVARYLKT